MIGYGALSTHLWVGCQNVHQLPYGTSFAIKLVWYWLCRNLLVANTSLILIDPPGTTIQGMMFWAVGIICYCFKNAQLHDGQLQPAMAVSVAVQLIYISKFFHWEAGYMCSMDIQHDRAGYYICWGCLNWVPAVYTSQAFYLTTKSLCNN